MTGAAWVRIAGESDILFNLKLFNQRLLDVEYPVVKLYFLFAVSQGIFFFFLLLKLLDVFS